MKVSRAPDSALLTFAAAKPTETWPTSRPFSHSGVLPAATGRACRTERRGRGWPMRNGSVVSGSGSSYVIGVPMSAELPAFAADLRHVLDALGESA